MPKTLRFFTRANGPEAPAKALRRSKAADSKAVNVTLGAIVAAEMVALLVTWRKVEKFFNCSLLSSLHPFILSSHMLARLIFRTRS
jgi:hypothetical protein